MNYQHSLPVLAQALLVPARILQQLHRDSPLCSRFAFNASGMRLPIVMSIANRALGAPLSIWNDQQDSISLRDSGWLQFYAEDNQEATDLHYLAYRVAEDHSVLLPAFVCFDGFILSHTYEPIDMLTQEDIDKFLPKFTPYERLDAADPISFGMYATPEYYLEFRYEMDRCLKESEAIIQQGRKRIRRDVREGLQCNGRRLPA